MQGSASGIGRKGESQSQSQSNFESESESIRLTRAWRFDLFVLSGFSRQVQKPASQWSDTCTALSHSLSLANKKNSVVSLKCP